MESVSRTVRDRSASAPSEHEALAQLARRMRRICPPLVVSAPQREATVRRVEHRAELCRLKRTAAAMVLAFAATGLLLGHVLSRGSGRSDAPGSRPLGRSAALSQPVSALPDAACPAGPKAVVGAAAARFVSAGEAPVVVDLGIEVGKVLLEPGARASYEPALRLLRLEHGSAILHIVKAGRGFQVHAGPQRLQVHGTLFQVDTERVATRVFEGTVARHLVGQAADVRLLHGSKDLSDLSARTLRWLGVAPRAFSSASRTLTQRPRQLPRRPSAPAPLPEARQPAEAFSEPQVPPPSTRTATVENRQPALPKSPDLAQERRELLTARAALLEGHAVRALELLTRYVHTNPHGKFVEEARLLALQALLALRRYGELGRAAQAFARDYPDSPKLPEIRRLVQQNQR